CAREGGVYGYWYFDVW
nr:immunoglobulin heavy chain junction region [Mus musculus]